MRRVRLLIYEGPDRWIETTREREWVKAGKNEISNGKSIASYDLPDDIYVWLMLKLKEVGAL